MSSPDLSVIIPTYNRLPLLREALASFVGLLNCSHEVVIVDDGSTDGTAEYLRTLGEPHRVFFQEHKGGNAARNYGLREARGQHVKFLDDDDWLIASMVDQQIYYLNIHHEADACYSDYGMIDDHGRNEIRRTTINTTLENLLSGQRKYLVGYPPLAYTLRFSAVQGIEWDETLTSNQEYDYFLRLVLAHTTFGYLPGCIGWARNDYDRDRVSSKLPDHRRTRRLNLIYVVRKVQAHLEVQGELTDNMRRVLAKKYFDLAEAVYFIDQDRKRFKDMVRLVLDLYPEFEPSRPRFRLLKNLFGYEIAEFLSYTRRRIK